MGVSKVILNGVTKVDLTGDTVEESNLLSGYQATGADGERVSGAFSVSEMTGATASTDGTSGLVPAPSAGDQDKVLHGDGTWDIAYTPPTYTARNNGLYKITVNTLGHVSNATAVQKSDITALGIPAQDTTYSAATTTTAGLMSSDDKTKLNSVEEGANNYVHPTYTARTGKPTANQTPGFGDTVTVSQITSNTLGHVTGATDRTIKIPDTEASTTAAGLMSADDKTKLDGIEEGANAYTPPTYTAHSNGLYKITTNTLGHVSAATAVAKSDITALGIPAQDTTYESKAAVSGGTAVSLVTTGEKATWNAKTSNTGTVTSVATGVGLTGGSITTSGTIKAKLRSETALTRDSAAATETANRVYPVAQDKSGYLAVNVPWTDTNTQTITGVKGSAETTYRTGNVSLSAANVGAAEVSHTHAASDIVSGTLDTARIPDLAASKITSGTFNAARLPAASTTTQGAMSADDKEKLDGIEEGANNYVPPTYTAHSSGLYKVTVNTLGHVSAATAVSKSDITGLGIPAQDTTYSEASSSAAGLMSSTDKAKLDGIVMAKWVNMGTISSLPVTKTFSGVTTDMVCAKMELGTPSAQTGNWTINTDTADSVTISGAVSGSTTCKLLLVQAESGTAS